MPHIQLIDQQPVHLKKEHDLGFISSFGRVFCVFDQLSDGNLCFGTERDGRRYYVKYAGAPCVNDIGRPGDAVARLMHAAGLYRAIRHPCLAPLLHEGHAGEGYVCVFPWLEGLPLGPFSGGYRQLKELDFFTRCAMLDSLFSLLCELSQHDHVAVGLDDSHLLADFDARRVYLTSIDSFLPMPVRNRLGALPGAQRFQPPEAAQQDAMLDEAYTVYVMGALANAFLGIEDTLTSRFMEGTEPMRGLVRAALSADVKKRPASAEHFLNAWRGIVRAIPADFSRQNRLSQ